MNRFTDDEIIEVHLVLTGFEAAMLVAGANEFYHHLKAVNDDDTYGPLIQDRTVLAAREVWRKCEDQVGVAEWSNPNEG